MGQERNVSELLLVSYGRLAAETLRRAIARAKGDGPLQPVTVAVPSNYAGLSLRRLLGSEGRGLVNVRFIVLARVAELLGSPALAADGKRPLTNAAEAEAVRAALAEAPGIFRQVRENVATERGIEATFRELRRAPEDALEKLASQSSRAADVVRLYRDFRQRTSAYYDEEDLALAAATAVSECCLALRDIGHVVIYLPQRLSPAERIMLEALAKSDRLTVIVGLTGDAEADAPARRLIAQLEGACGPPLESAEHAEVAKAQIVMVTDAEEEVRAVVRSIMEHAARGVPLHRIGVLYRAEQPYALLAEEQFNAAGVPHNGPGTRTLSQTLTGRTLLGLLRLRSTDFRRDALMDWLSAAPVLEEEGGNPAPAQRWDLLSRTAGVVRGPLQWRDRLAGHSRALKAERESLEKMEETSGAQLRHFDSEIDHTERLARFVEELAERLAPAAPRPWSGQVAWARGVLDRYLGGEGHRRNWPEKEIEAYRKVTAALESLSALGDLRPEVDEATFRRALERDLEASAGRNNRFGEGVFVGRIADAVGMDFDLAFLLGMSEGLMPPRGKDDPLMPDRERAPAGEEVPLRATRTEEERRNYLAALASARSLVFVFPRADLRGQRGKLPSRWLLEQASALEGRALYSSDMDSPPRRDWLKVVPSFQAALAGDNEPASEQEYDLRSLLLWGRSGGKVEQHYLLKEQTALGIGIEAGLGRQSRQFTRWDGFVAAAAAPSLSQGRAVSPTALQTWSSCPFHYFLQNVLRISETEKPEDTLTISALDRGTLLHEALERFMREVEPRTTPDQPWDDSESQMMRDIGEQLCAEAEAAGLTGKPLLWHLEREKIMRDLDGFLDADEEMRQQEGVLPLDVELAFGVRGATNTAATIELESGRTVMLRGKIDRLDKTPDGSRLVVLDYKTGAAGFYRKMSDDPLRRGTLLQLPIYALAASQVHGVEDVDAYYWFIAEEEGYKREGCAVGPGLLDEFRRVLAIIIDGIDSGIFPARPGKSVLNSYENCKLCNYELACLRARSRPWERKREAPELTPYREMAEPNE